MGGRADAQTKLCSHWVSGQKAKATDRHPSLKTLISATSTITKKTPSLWSRQRSFLWSSYGDLSFPLSLSLSLSTGSQFWISLFPVLSQFSSHLVQYPVALLWLTIPTFQGSRYFFLIFSLMIFFCRQMSMNQQHQESSRRRGRSRSSLSVGLILMHCLIWALKSSSSFSMLVLVEGSFICS